MLEQLERMKDVSGLPKVEIRTPNQFFQRLENNSMNLPTWVGELYFEFHRGTYTTQAKVKKSNRLSEFLLREVESIYSLLFILSQKKFDYPLQHINQLWENVLLNQFHDVLPGLICFYFIFNFIYFYFIFIFILILILILFLFLFLF